MSTNAYVCSCFNFIYLLLNGNIYWLQIVQQCKGFPLAIKVVGRSLAGQPAEMWESREIEWSRGSLILDTETELFLCLQSSFDALDEKLKECFLDLGSFPEDKQIPVAALMDMWAESFALDRDALCIAKLQELNNRSLANLLDTRYVVRASISFILITFTLSRLQNMIPEYDACMLKKSFC